MNLRIALPPSLRLQAVAGLVLALGFTPVAQAFLFDFAGAKGSFDTTISIGGLYRVNDADRDLYGLSAGGLQRSVNADDGNLNYRSGMVSFLAKANHDLFLKYKNSGVFVRGFYFNDFVNSSGNRLRTPDVPQSLPLDLLARRADVMAARWRVESARGMSDAARGRGSSSRWRWSGCWPCSPRSAGQPWRWLRCRCCWRSR